jgi:hypothetical protein
LIAVTPHPGTGAITTITSLKSGSIGELLKRRKKKGGRVKSEILGIISIMILTVFLL